MLIKLARVVAYLILISSIILVATCIVVMPDCGQNSDAVRYARSLSDERLHDLFYDMEEFSKRNSTPSHGYNMLNEEIPKEFADLEVVKIRPKEGNIMVEGCFDHYVYLDFGGLGNYPNPKSRLIQVRWGEGSSAGAEVLWSE